MPKVSNYMRTRIELLHKQALHPAGIFRSSKSGGLLVSLASISRSWIIKELQITGFVANLLCSGRPAKFSVHAKSIYRSTDAKKWWQTFLVKKFFFLQLSRKHEERCGHYWLLNKFDLPPSSLFSRNRISSCGEEIIWFLGFRLIFTYESLLLFSVVFSNVSHNSTRKEILLHLVSFCPPKSINLFFCTFNFSASVVTRY